MQPGSVRNQRIPCVVFSLPFGPCLGIASLLLFLSLAGGSDLRAGGLRVEITGPGTASVQGNVVRIRTEVGSRFIVVVPSNPTTGYTWRLEGGDASVCAIADSSYEGSETGRIGAGGHEFWTFRAMGPGRTQGVLVYTRPWEKDNAPVRTVQLDVTVH